jgi:hypothetical protein
VHTVSPGQQAACARFQAAFFTGIDVGSRLLLLDFRARVALPFMCVLDCCGIR